MMGTYSRMGELFFFSFLRLFYYIFLGGGEVLICGLVLINSFAHQGGSSFEMLAYSN